MKSFQIVVIGIFVFFIIIGVITFATFRGEDGASLETVEIWGSLDSVAFVDTVTKANLDLAERVRMTYTQIREEDFDEELIEALAAGSGPDIILLPQDLIARYEDKVLTIPFESYPERDFKSSFIEEGELYINNEGILALPFSVDPLVMYWNRALFANEGIASPPKYWDEMYNIAQRLSKVDERGNILQSAVALGTFENIANAKEILILLMMQAGNPITIRDARGDIDSVLDQKLGQFEAPAEAGLRFYTEFVDPSKNIYSWGPSRPESLQAFLSGELAIYLGFASELKEIQDKNPNLNFDVSPIPQVRDSDREASFGRMNALAVVSGSKRQPSAFAAIGILSSPTTLAIWEEVTGLPPVRRGMLRPDLNPSRPTAIESFRSVFHDMAIVSTAFLDPAREETDAIFSDMVEGVISGRVRISEAITSASNRLESLTL